jgi:hypothetical protein
VAEDFILNVKQISQYPLTQSVGTGDVTLLQKGGLGGPYNSMLPSDLVATALEIGEWMHMAAGFGIAWNGCQLSSDGITINVPSLHSAGDVFVAGNALATQANVDALFDSILLNSVFSFNGRKGDVQLEADDVLRAGGAPIRDAHLGGFNTSPTPWDFRANDDQIATTAFVQNVITQLLCSGSIVTSFNGRGGDVVLSTADVNAAYANYPVDGIVPTAPNPAFGDASNRIATTLFVDESVEDLRQWTINYIASGAGIDLSGYAPLASPNFSGIPTAPTATLGSSTGQLATTAFVANAVTASTTGVASFNTRTGAVVLTLADVTGAGGAPLASPIFTGNPQAPTAAPGDNDTSIASTAFVHAAIAALPTAPVTSFNTRTGAIVLLTADITGAGGAPTANPALTGTPTAPTATPGTSTTQLATTAFVAAAIATLGSSVTSFNGRSGAVSLIGNDISAAGGALLAAPAFTGAPTAPTATPGTSTTQLATTAFVQAAITAIAAGVASFNGRTGAVTLTTADITGAGGAPAASPAFSGVPTAPTPVTASNDTTVATTSFVKAAIAAGGVSSFNGRTGAVTLNSSDISAAGGALLASPGLTGTPTAPTATAGTNTTQLATTQFVTAALASAGGVSSWNGRAGTVTMTAADITGAGGALLASPALTGTPTAPTATAGTNTTQLATTAYVAAAVTAYQAWTFTTTGTMTTPSNATTATIYRGRMVGGGGGSGYVTVSGNTPTAGGGAGGYAEFTFSGIGPSVTLSPTIGTAGTGGNAITPSNATAGGASSLALSALSVTVTCNGGGFSQSIGSPGVTSPPSAGGTVSVAGSNAAFKMLASFQGEAGDGVLAAGNMAVGGSGPFGAGGRPGTTTANAVAASGFGAGGSGQAVLGNNGYAGVGGYLIIERIAG